MLGDPGRPVRWLAVPEDGHRRAASRFVRPLVALLAIAALGGCGTPAHLDRDEQVAFARECASLVERNVADAKTPRRVQVGDETLTLDDADAFYSQLEKLRGPSTYNLHDAKHDSDTGRQPLDDCNPKAPILNSIFKSNSSSSTTTTTTAPGS